MENITINITLKPQAVTVNATGLRGPVGPQGPQGPPGTVGAGNLFIQESQPVLDKNLIWFELRNDNSLKTIWVNTI